MDNSTKYSRLTLTLGLCKAVKETEMRGQNVCEMLVWVLVHCVTEVNLAITLFPLLTYWLLIKSHAYLWGAGKGGSIVVCVLVMGL